LDRLKASGNAHEGMIVPTMDELGDLLLRDALRERASDIHLDPLTTGYRVRLRVDGAVYDASATDTALGERIVRHFRALSGIEPGHLPLPIDGRQTYHLDGREVDLRLAVAPTACGEKLTLRVLDRESARQDMHTLGMRDDQLARVREWLRNVSGMFLVVGPTGCGKTTTAYALLHQMKMMRRSIASIEDPVEYQVDGLTQMQVNPRAGLTFAEAVRSMMRLDADFILVGEMRDAESAHAAVEAAGRGRVLMTTLHARDAVSAVSALRAWGVADHAIAATLEVVVAQRLVRVLCPACRREELATDLDRRWFEALDIRIPDHTWEPVGCAQCQNTGYRGRTGVFEVWHLDDDDYRRILEGADEHAMRRSLAERGLKSLLDDGLAKANTGVTSLEELRVMATAYPPRSPPHKTPRAATRARGGG
jgi:type II secretory ATPase GspE/PulE/Tfp pilus assembly ATPase PilB-like protein